MARFSVVVPLYNGARHIEECLLSVLGQTFDDFELIVVDDGSTDDSVRLVRDLCGSDARIRLIVRKKNGGTLRARRDGVLASSGEYVLLVDQDDALVRDALKHIDSELCSLPVDILHFGVNVIAESARAFDAADGMSNFLVPTPRELFGEEILTKQFSGCDGFDWHVHHKAFRGDLARAAWSSAEDVALVLSDDLYASFLLCSRAESYRAVSARWYEYHLGRGDTLGSALTLEAFRKLNERDAAAYALVSRAARVLGRKDIDGRVADVRDRLIEHVMNELHDNLPAEDQPSGIDDALGKWPADAVAGELFRFVRDRAYELFDTGIAPMSDDALFFLLSYAAHADALVGDEGSARYRSMREAAYRHLDDLRSVGSLPVDKKDASVLHRILSVLRRR